jgi:non-ribosomal peptide synthetase component F
VERALAHLEALLRSAVEEPGRRISELELLSDGERQQVVREWNATAVEYPRESSLQELFAAVAERFLEAPAVIGSDERLSYRELDERSTRLARELRNAGVGLEEKVGLCVERSAGAIVGILGILKAGGAYVPLDPSLPQERLDWMARDAGVRVVVTAGHPAGYALGIPTVETPHGASLQSGGRRTGLRTFSIRQGRQAGPRAWR